MTYTLYVDTDGSQGRHQSALKAVTGPSLRAIWRELSSRLTVDGYHSLVAAERWEHRVACGCVVRASLGGGENSIVIQLSAVEEAGMSSRADETRAVRLAVRAVEGLDRRSVRVRHGTGTAWGWLDVTACLHSSAPPHERGRDCRSNRLDRCVCASRYHTCYIDCARCVMTSRVGDRMIEAIRIASGRDEYGMAEVNVSIAV